MKANISNRDRAGFSLLELMVVVGVAMAISAIAIPSMTTAIANARLRASMSSLSGLLQNSRMVAVKENKTMSTHFTIRANGLVGYVKNAADTSEVATSDFQIEMAAPISKLITPSGAGAPAGVTSAVLGYTAQTGDPSFNSRGIPCVYSAGTCATNNGFAYYFKDSRISGPGAWAAISVSPAGRIKRWFWNGSDWTD